MMDKLLNLNHLAEVFNSDLNLEGNRQKTFLKTDKLISVWSVMVPAGLVLCIQFFDETAFRSNSITCSVSQESFWTEINQNNRNRDQNYDQNFNENTVKSSDYNNQRFFPNMFCWENLVHHVLNESSSGINYIETKSLEYHKTFPYAVILLAVLISCPTLVWMKFLRQSFMHTLNLVATNIEEVVKTEIALLLELESRDKLATGNSIPNRSFSMKSASALAKSFKKLITSSAKKERSIGKFFTFKHTLEELSYSTKLASKYFLYRLSIIILLGCISCFVQHTYISENLNTFNCLVDYQSLSQFSNDPVHSEIIKCSFSGVNTRIWICYFWILSNCVIIGITIIGSINDLISLSGSIEVLSLIDPIDCLDSERLKLKHNSSWHGISDLQITLMLVKHNFASEKGSSSLNLALRSLKIMNEIFEMENATREEISDHYLKVLLLSLVQHKSVQGEDAVNRIVNGLKIAVTVGIGSRNKNDELADGEVKENGDTEVDEDKKDV